MRQQEWNALWQNIERMKAGKKVKQREFERSSEEFWAGMEATERRNMERMMNPNGCPLQRWGHCVGCEKGHHRYPDSWRCQSGAAGQGPIMPRQGQQLLEPDFARPPQNSGEPSFAATGYRSGNKSSRRADPPQNMAEPSFAATGYRGGNRSSRRNDPGHNFGAPSFVATDYQSANRSARPSGRGEAPQHAGPTFGPAATHPYRGSHRSGRGGGRGSNSEFAGPTFGPAASQPYRGSYRSGRGGGSSRRF